MILDVTRHKFSEALLTLLFFAVAISVVAMFLSPHVSGIVEGVEAPLAIYLNSFRAEYPLMSAILLCLLYIYIVLRISRSTVRVGLYPSTTLAAIPICSVALFGALCTYDYAVVALSALLIAEAFGRLQYCFAPSIRPHHLFSAMVAFGALPLIDTAFVPFSLIIPLFVIIMRGTLREIVLILFGLALPSFAYCYISWLCGSNFIECFIDMWANIMASSRLSLVAYLTLPRLVFLGVIFFLQLATSVVYVSTPLSINTGVREVWRILQFSVVVLLASLLLLPAASPSLIVAMVIISAIMYPLLFQYVSVMQSVLVYILLIISTFIPILGYFVVVA